METTQLEDENREIVSKTRPKVETMVLETDESQQYRVGYIQLTFSFVMFITISFPVFTGLIDTSIFGGASSAVMRFFLPISISSLIFQPMFYIFINLGIDPISLLTDLIISWSVGGIITGIIFQERGSGGMLKVTRSFSRIFTQLYLITLLFLTVSTSANDLEQESWRFYESFFQLELIIPLVLVVIIFFLLASISSLTYRIGKIISS